MPAADTVGSAAAIAWWIWPIALFLTTFVLGIVAVLSGVGGGVLFVPIVGSFFPFHLDFVRGTGLLLALSGALLGLALLVAGFAAYAGGLLPPHVPLAELARSWHLPLAQFAAATGAPTGWQWLQLAGRGDYFNFVGIAVLASIIIAAYLRVLSLVARKDRTFAVIAALEIIVLLAAASGLLNSFGGAIS